MHNEPDIPDPEDETVTDEPSWDGFEDCPHCDGQGCDECDYTGEYR